LRRTIAAQLEDLRWFKSALHSTPQVVAEFFLELVETCSARRQSRGGAVAAANLILRHPYDAGEARRESDGSPRHAELSMLRDAEISDVPMRVENSLSIAAVNGPLLDAGQQNGPSSPLAAAS
jgi:hypothetical protein